MREYKSTPEERARAKAWYEENKERALANAAAYRADNKDKIRWREVAKRYGVSEYEYVCMLDDQDGHCALCPATERDGRGGPLCVDHDHATGKVRGLLCGACNHGLGKFQDDPARLRAAADYIEEA